jgi:hypothetical protein
MSETKFAALLRRDACTPRVALFLKADIAFQSGTP